jgi:hypothetical protein
MYFSSEIEAAKGPKSELRTQRGLLSATLAKHLIEFSDR